MAKVMITTNFTLNAKRPLTTGEKAELSYMHPSVATMTMIIIILQNYEWEWFVAGSDDDDLVFGSDDDDLVELFPPTS